MKRALPSTIRRLVAFRLGPIVPSTSRHGRQAPLFLELRRRFSFRGRNRKKESAPRIRPLAPPRILLLFCFVPLAGPPLALVSARISLERADPFIFESFRIIALVSPART